jgi:Bacteriocin-protection, YdeI or OmpD-Associated
VVAVLDWRVSGRAVAWHHGRVGASRFTAIVTTDSGGRAVVAVPFDPDQVWGAKAFHLVGGMIERARPAACNRRLRGRITSDAGRWVLTLNSRWMGEAGVDIGDEVIVALEPEGPQRSDLAEDFATALAASPTAGAFFDTLAQFYRKAYLQYVDATTRRPEVRAERIAEVVQLLGDGVKARPRP